MPGALDPLCVPADQARESESLRVRAEQTDRPAPARSLLAGARLDQPVSRARRAQPAPPEQRAEAKVAALSDEQLIERLGGHGILEARLEDLRREPSESR